MSFFLKRSSKLLLDAVREENLEAVRVLLENGANVRTRDDDDVGNGALHHALLRGNACALVMLLEHGADPDAENRLGVRAVELALELARPDCLEALLRHGASLDFPRFEELMSRAPRSLVDLVARWRAGY